MNSWSRPAKIPTRSTAGFSGHKIIGGFPLKKFYPELGNAALWCCTELTTRGADRHRRGLVAESERSVKSANAEADVQEVAR